MVNKENYYGEYKGHTKWLSLISGHFAKNILKNQNVANRRVDDVKSFVGGYKYCHIHRNVLW